MKIIRKTSPYLRRPGANAQRMMRDVTIALMPVTIFAIYQFGMAAVMILSLSIIGMTVTEYLYYQFKDNFDGEDFKFINKSFTLYNFSAITSALIYGLILPDATPWYIVLIGASFGMFFGKIIFGGMGQNVFNPAALARVFVVFSFGTLVTYDIDTVAGATALGQLNIDVFSSSVLDNFALVDLFTGIIFCQS